MRDLTPEFELAITSSLVKFMYLVKIYFDSGIEAWTTSYRQIEYNNTVYFPAGHLATLSAVKETTGVKSSVLNLGLSGIDPNITALLLSEPYLGRKAEIYTVLTDETYFFSEDLVKLLFVGTLDIISGEQGKTASFDIPVKSRLADWERTRSIKNSDAEQQRLYPGDKGMEYIPQLSKKKIIWPRAALLIDPRR